VICIWPTIFYKGFSFICFSIQWTCDIAKVAFELNPKTLNSTEFRKLKGYAKKLFITRAECARKVREMILQCITFSASPSVHQLSTSICVFEIWAYNFWYPWTILFSKICHMLGLFCNSSYAVFVYLCICVFVYLCICIFIFAFLTPGNIIFEILEQSSFQKYATCWVFLALRHMLYLCMCILYLRVWHMGI